MSRLTNRQRFLNKADSIAHHVRGKSMAHHGIHQFISCLTRVSLIEKVRGVSVNEEKGVGVNEKLLPPFWRILKGPADRRP